MNHWFLCARDVMWFFFAVSPIIGGGLAITAGFKDEDFGAMFWLLFMSICIQFGGIVGLYIGVIK